MIEGKEPTNFLQAISSGVVLEILKHLDFFSLIQCRRVCWHLRDLVGSSLILQYKIELAVAGQQDGGYKEAFIRRQMLQEHQCRWTTMNWTGHRPLSMFFPGFWELCGGVLVQTEELSQTVQLYITRLPSRCRGIQESNWMIDIGEVDVADIGMDPGQNLLVIVERLMWQPVSGRTFKVHFRELSTGKPHPLALVPYVLTPQNTWVSGVCYYTEIFRDTLAVFLRYTPYPNEVVLWDWKTGNIRLHLSGAEISSMIFLDENYVMTAVWHRTDPCLLVVDLNTASCERRELGELENAFIFRLPLFSHSTPVYNAVVRSNPQPTGTLPPESEIPFTTSAVNRLCLVYFDLREAEAPCLVALQSSFTSLIKSGAARNRKIFDWHVWGPERSRLLPAISFPPVFHLSSYGTRLVATRQAGTRETWVDVYDFNQLSLRKRNQEDTVLLGAPTHGRADICGPICVTAPTNIAAGMFLEDVETRLPYRMTSWKVPGMRPTSGMFAMCSDDGIVLAVSESTYANIVLIKRRKKEERTCTIYTPCESV